MKNKIFKQTFLLASMSALMLTASLTVKAGDSQFSFNGIQLCGNFEEAVEILRKKGFYDGLPPGHLDRLVQQAMKHGGGFATRKGQNDKIKYHLRSQNGKLVGIQYDARDTADTATEAQQAHETAASVTGMTPRCSNRNGMDLCQYRSKKVQIVIRSSLTPARVNINASSQCK